MAQTPQPSRQHSWALRFAWLIGIWAASISALAVVAYLLRLVMGWVGMTV